MMDFAALAQQCAPDVAPQTMAAVVNVESDYNPFAIGVVNGHLERQPKTKAEAVATAKALKLADWNFSVGVAQVNRYNLSKYGLTFETAFDPCKNIRAASEILKACYTRASLHIPNNQEALKAAFSCYYSGNFKRGFVPDSSGQPSYVQKVLASADEPTKAIPVVPSIKRGQAKAPQKPRRPHNQSAPEARPDNGPVLLHATRPEDQTTNVGEGKRPPKNNDKNQPGSKNPALVF